MKLIAQALCKAQKAFAPALKTATNPHFKSKYVGLDGCVEAVIDALNSNGIYLMQKSHDCDNGVKIETILLHESGEEYSGGILHVPASKNDAQGYGSALTYARRYSLMATCGIAPEDDDGNAASKQTFRNTHGDASGQGDTGFKQTDNKRLPSLTTKEAEEAYNKWVKQKETLIAEDGKIDNDKVTEEWLKFPSNVRTAITAYGNALKAKEAETELQNNHINEIAKVS